MTMHADVDCEDCGGKACVARDVVTQTFIYGSGSEAATLSAEVPVWTCVKCGEAYTDHEGETARHEAVCRHLERPTPREINDFRQGSGMSLENLAAFGGFDLEAVRGWEDGARIPTASEAARIAVLMQGVAPASGGGEARG